MLTILPDKMSKYNIDATEIKTNRMTDDESEVKEKNQYLMSNQFIP